MLWTGVPPSGLRSSASTRSRESTTLRGRRDAAANPLDGQAPIDYTDSSTTQWSRSELDPERSAMPLRLSPAFPRSRLQQSWPGSPDPAPPEARRACRRSGAWNGIPSCHCRSQRRRVGLSFELSLCISAFDRLGAGHAPQTASTALAIRWSAVGSCRDNCAGGPFEGHPPVPPTKIKNKPEKLFRINKSWKKQT